MASMKRILKNLQALRVFFYAPSRSSAHRQMISTREALKWKNYGGSNSEWFTNRGRLRYVLPAILAGSFVGSSLSPLVYAESPSSTQSDTGSGTELDPLSQNIWMEKTVRKVRESLEERMRNKGLQRGAYPSFIVAVKGQQVSIKFRTSQSSQVSNIIADLLLHHGQGSQERGACEVKIQALDSASNKKVLLIFPKGLKDPMHGGFLSEEEPGGEGELHVLISESGIGSSNIEFEFAKQGLFSTEDLEALARSLETASNLSEGRKEIKSKVFSERRDSTNGARVNVDKKSLSELESMGVKVFGLDWVDEDSGREVISWDIVAGYEKQKREIEDTILLALNKPEVYDAIAHGTRYKFESNRPRAVLFEGPPGTGKTSCARVIANQAHVPLLYVPLEVVMSKYYGESERLLGTVFNLANELSDGAIVFLDEVDSFAATRDNEMHEATRRILSVLLRQIDGFEQEKRVVVIAATNRKQDLDPALISRFDSVITFGLPDQPDRQKIVSKYAKHLDKNELVELSLALEGMSGRDIRDVCLQAERRWASKIIREQIPNGKSKNDLPPIDEYLDSAADRRGTMFDIGANSGHPTFHSKNQKMAFSS